MVASRWRIGAVAVLLALVGGLGFAAVADDEEPRRRPALVYLSGLDDHLLDRYDTVPLHRTPGGPISHEAPTDSLAWVHGGEGEWLEIELAEGEALRGWVADFHLRGELHLVDPDAPGCPVPTAAGPGGVPGRPFDPSTRVRLVDLGRHGDDSWVAVRAPRTDTIAWVPRRMLSELPGPDVRRAAAGTPCAEIVPEPVPSHTH